MGNWDNLSLTEKAAMIRVAVKNGITNLQDIKREYNEFAEGGDTNPGMTGMMKSKLATAAHFGNPTARRMTNYDARSYTWPGEYDYDNGIGELKRGNVFVGSYDNLVTPQIQDDGKGLIFVDDVWSPENDQRSYMQSLKFSNEKDARYFGEHYKEIAPMMNIYAGGGSKDDGYNNFVAYTQLAEGAHWQSQQDDFKKRTGKSATQYYWDEAKRRHKDKWDKWAPSQRIAVADTMYNYGYWDGTFDAYKYDMNVKGVDNNAYWKKYGKGHTRRFNERKKMFYGNEIPEMIAAPKDANIRIPSIQEYVQPFIPTFMPSNPEVFFATPDTYQQPIVVEEPEVQEPVVISPYSPEEIDRQERINKLSTFNKILSLTNPYPQEDNSFLSTIGLLTGNTFSKGGGIHIKPSHRGRLTELKERTGKSEAELYKTGGPAVRKMITFARNARKWKHGLGGNLYDGTSQHSQQMDNSYTYYKPLDNIFVDSEGNLLDPSVPSARGSIRTPDVVVTANPIDVGRGKAKRMLENAFIESNDATATPYTTNSHLNERGIEGAAKAAAWMQDNPTLNNVGMALGAVPLAVAGYPAFMAAGEGTATALANPYVDAALTSGFGAHGLNHVFNEGINGWGDAAMTALEVAPLGRLAKPMYYAGKEGLQYAAKVVDNAARYASPSYDLYRTIGETTPRTTPTYRGVRLNGEQAYTGSPLFEFANIQRTSPSESYFFRAPNDIDILKLWNGRFRSKAQGNIVLPSGNVNGKFVSYGEPWQEFDFGEGSALYEFPVGPRRGSSRMATDWRGNKQDFSVNEAYEFMQQEKALSKELRELRNKGTINSEREEREIRKRLIQDKYALVGDTRFSSSINSANQTVIPNERWNFDWFLKTPFWKYSENPISGQVQKELMMRWPEAKHLETPTIEWTDALKTPQITAENAASITPIPNNSSIRYAGSAKEDYSNSGYGLLDYIRNDKINAFLEGKPFYEMDLGPLGTRKESFPSDWTMTKMPFSDESKEIINNSAKPRILAQAEKDIRDVYDPAIDGPDIEKYVKEELSYIEKQLDEKINEGYELGSEALFKAHDEGKTATRTGGLQLTNNGKIILREGEDPEKFAVHEWEHRRTNGNIRGAHYGNEKKVLRKAFTKEFRELSETVPDFKGMNMDDEMVTTVSDTREALIGKTHLRKTAPDLQNKMIDKSSDEKIFEAVEKANAYGTFYIKRMRELGKLTPELAQNIREALKHVGGYAIPTAIAAGSLYGKQE